MADQSDPYAGMTIEERIAHIKGGSGATSAAPATSDPGDLHAPLPAGALPPGSKLDDRTIEQMEGQAPSLTPAPSDISTWPGIISRTYERSIPSWAHGVDVLGLHTPDRPGEPPSATSGSPVPEYDQGLGLGQRIAATAANPWADIAAVGGALVGHPEIAGSFLGGDLGAWTMAEAGHPEWEAPASVVAGLGSGAAVESGTAKLIADANQPGTIARHLAGEGGFELPGTIGMPGQLNAATVDTAGRVLQQELNTTRWPPSSPLLRNIRGAATPTEAFNLATDPANLTARFVNNMSPRARTAIAATYAHSVPSNPGAWTGLTEDVRRALIPEDRIRTAVTNAATQAQRTAAAAAANPGGFWPWVQNMLNNHLLSKGAGAIAGGLAGRAVGVGSPVGEAVGTLVGSQLRNTVASTIRNPLSAATRAGAGYAAGRMGEPGTTASPQSRTRNLLNP